MVSSAAEKTASAARKLTGLSHGRTMPRNVYSEINLHITWHTKGRAAVIVDEIERQLVVFIQRKIAEASGVELQAIGGTADHVHLAVIVPPTLNVSEWIGQIKGASAHHINHRIANRGVLEWQTGYGVVSFGAKGLPWVVEYIRNQKENHARGSTHDRLERVERVEARKRAEPDFNGVSREPAVKRLA